MSALFDEYSSSSSSEDDGKKEEFSQMDFIPQSKYHFSHSFNLSHPVQDFLRYLNLIIT